MKYAAAGLAAMLLCGCSAFQNDKDQVQTPPETDLASEEARLFAESDEGTSLNVLGYKNGQDLSSAAPPETSGPYAELDRIPHRGQSDFEDSSRPPYYGSDHW